MTLSLSLSLPEENDDAAEEEAEGWRRGVVRGFRVKGWKAFLFAARVPTLHVVFTEKCTFTEMKETARLFVSSTRFQFLSLSLSRLIPSFFISSLARFSSSMASRRAHAPLSVETEVASGFFTARDRCASRSFPHDYATRRAFVLA